jgi:CRISPR type IV-associated protein Csf1
MASGLNCRGAHRCYYCGAPCGKKRLAAQHVKDSFTGRSGVVAPGSPWVCEGCLLCLRETAGITLIDGETRDGQKVRGYSWLLTAKKSLAMTKSHIPAIRQLCLSPPKPPFAIVLSDSGQTHQLYRGVVNHARDPVTVTLEAERISYRVADLAALLPVAGKLAAALGKPVLSESIPPARAFKVFDRYTTEADVLLDTWSHHWSTGLGRLASWLTPRKEECERAYPTETEEEARAGQGQAGGKQQQQWQRQ